MLTATSPQVYTSKRHPCTGCCALRPFLLMEESAGPRGSTYLQSAPSSALHLRLRIPHPNGPEPRPGPGQGLPPGAVLLARVGDGGAVSPGRPSSGLRAAVWGSVLLEPHPAGLQPQGPLGVWSLLPSREWEVKGLGVGGLPNFLCIPGENSKRPGSSELAPGIPGLQEVTCQDT